MLEDGEIQSKKKKYRWLKAKLSKGLHTWLAEIFKTFFWQADSEISLEEEIQSKMDEPQKYYSYWKKLNTKDNVFYDSIYVRGPEKAEL